MFLPIDVISVLRTTGDGDAKIQVLVSSDELEWSQAHPIVKFRSSLREAKFGGCVAPGSGH